MDVILFQFAVLILSIIVHEVSHGYMAEALGDPTARNEGRLTLNPLSHIDLFGSIILPLLTYTSSGLVFGWAKPVPYNPYNLRRGKWGEALVAFAGPLSNICVALVFGLTVRFFSEVLPPSFLDISSYIVIINLVLAVFNLVPIPPLDGSKILFSFLPYHYVNLRRHLEMYSIFLVLLFVIFAWKFVSPVGFVFFSLITGIPL